MTFKAEVTVLLPMQRIAPIDRVQAFCQTGAVKRGANAHRTDWISGGKPFSMKDLL
jgi:hypothetical protein